MELWPTHHLLCCDNLLWQISKAGCEANEVHTGHRHTVTHTQSQTSPLLLIIGPTVYISEEICYSLFTFSVVSLSLHLLIDGLWLICQHWSLDNYTCNQAASHTSYTPRSLFLSSYKYAHACIFPEMNQIKGMLHTQKETPSCYLLHCCSGYRHRMDIFREFEFQLLYNLSNCRIY